MSGENWKNYNINIGQVKEDSSVTFEFESNKTLDIKKIEPGCAGCTVIGGYKDNKLKVTFKSGKIPYHITTKSQSVIKTIFVYYNSGETEILRYNAIIIR